MEVNNQLHALAAFLPGKEPLDRRLGMPQSWSGCSSEEKIPIVQPIAQSYTTELSWL
jgi:hypothetical protein